LYALRGVETVSTGTATGKVAQVSEGAGQAYDTGSARARGLLVKVRALSSRFGSISYLFAVENSLVYPLQSVGLKQFRLCDYLFP